jgi:hypothetical protein
MNINNEYVVTHVSPDFIRGVVEHFESFYKGNDTEHRK